MNTGRSILALLAITTPLAPASAAPTIEAQFIRIGEAVGAVAVKIQAQDPNLDALQQDLVALQENSDKIDPNDAEDYALSLGHDAALLEQASSASDALRASIIADVASDIAIKRNAGTGLGAGTSFSGRVAIRVVTKRGTLFVPGFVITLNPVRWSGQEPMYRLAHFSPADGAVPPGRYEVIASRDGVAVARDVLPVGLSGDDRIDIELAVP